MSSLPSPSLAANQPAPKRSGWLLQSLRWATTLVVVLWSLLLLAWLTLHWGILPRLDHWRPQIEQQVGRALGAPLSIGSIRARSGSWVPAFELDDVRVLDRQGRVALSLGRVSAALSPASLLALELRFAQLHLDGVNLDVRRDAQGRVSVAGLDLDAGGPAADAAASPGADWLLAQHEIVIRNGTLRWTDERRSGQPLSLSRVDLVLRNAHRTLSVRLDATPPPDWGVPVQVRGEFTRPLTARASDWQRWQGTLFAQLPEVDLSQLRQHVALPFELDQGRGALRAWLNVADGQLERGTADLALTAVALRLAPDLPLLSLAQLRGRVTAGEHAGGLDLAIEQLAFTTDDGVPWAPNTVRLALQRDPLARVDPADPLDARWAGGKLGIDRLDLAPLARLAARLPLPAAAHQALSDLAPQGEIQALSVDWSGPLRAPTTYRAAARARGLSLTAGPPGPPAWGMPQTAGRPGLRGAELEVQASETGGEAKLSLAAGALVFPGVFEQPELPVDQLSAQLSWRIEPGAKPALPALTVSVRQASFANADLRGQVSGSWRTGPGEGFGVGQRWPGIIELKGRIDGGEAQRIPRYLPIGVPAEVRSYLSRAIGPGRITEADFRSQGDLWRFPFLDDGPGEFLVRGKLQGLNYRYLPSEPGWDSPWPGLSGVSGEIEFNRAGMRLQNVQGLIGGVALRGVSGGIANLARDPVLVLDGQAGGALAGLLGFVNGTPVGAWIGGALRQAAVTGPGELSLALSIPLDHPDRSTVRGSVQLAGNDLRLLPGTPLMTQTRGRVDFTHQGVTVVGGRMRMLGGEATVEGGTQADGSLRFSGQGVATAEGLLRASDLPVLAPLAAWGSRFSGQTPYRAQLGFVQGLPELQVTSPLTGLALDLPAPLNKPAAAAWPLTLQTRLQTPASGAGPAVADVLQLNIGDLLQARYDRDLTGELVRVQRGAIGLGTQRPPMPSDGVIARLLLNRLDLDAWHALLPSADPNPNPAPVATAEAKLRSDAWPSRVELRVGQLQAAGRRLHGVSADLQHRTAAPQPFWHAEVAAEEAQGWVEWRPPRPGVVAGRVHAHLSRLAWPPVEPLVVQQAEALSASATAPTSTTSTITPTTARVPALSLVVDDFRVQGKSLGRLEVEADNRTSRRGAAEWQLDKLALTTADASLLASGLWSAGQRSSLAFDLNLIDGGAFFERLGAGKAMTGAQGRIEGELSWPGSPLAVELMSLRGQLAVSLGEGRFLNADPGAARLFGVLSLQALPRRLLLDFSDVFQEGLEFDSIGGDIRLQSGVARTDNLRVIGLQVGVLVEGSADLGQQTQDLRIVAVPELNTTTATLAWAALNPAVGIGAFIAQLLLREPMTAAATREFHVTGPWGSPVVQRVTAPAPEAGGSAPSANPTAPASPGLPNARTP